MTDLERAKFRGILNELKDLDEKKRLFNECEKGETFWDSSALQALCLGDDSKIDKHALNQLFNDENLLDPKNEPGETTIKDLFRKTRGWTLHESSLLDAAMMSMPESVRQKVAQYGPSTGQADNVNHQVQSDIPNLFERYIDRIKKLDSPPGSLNMIDSEFKAMVRLFSANAGELLDSLKKEFQRIVNVRLEKLTIKSLNTPEHQEALAVFERIGF